MIKGKVNAAYEAVMPLTVQGLDGLTQDIDAVIDAGFTGFLTLPPGIVTELELPFINVSQAILADGSEATLDVFRVNVLWDGEQRFVRAYASDPIPQVGMRLLDAHNLNIDVEEGGRVVIPAKG